MEFSRVASKFGVMTMEVRKNDRGDVLDQLDTLGLRCRKFIADGNEKIAQVARMVTEAKVRIDRDGEAFPGGFDHWVKVFVVDPPWDVPKLLTFGGWREAKKTGEVAPLETIAAKVTAVKATRAAGDRAARAQNKSARTYSPWKPNALRSRRMAAPPLAEQGAAVLKALDGWIDTIRTRGEAIDALPLDDKVAVVKKLMQALSPPTEPGTRPHVWQGVLVDFYLGTNDAPHAERVENILEEMQHKGVTIEQLKAAKSQ